MRTDMAKVIVERPRTASRVASIRRFKRLDPRLVALDDDEFDPLPKQIGLKKRVKLLRVQKRLNENLGPLKRYLESQVGRRWDDVWADICANLKPTSTVQQHVRDHVEDFVAFRTKEIDGTIWLHVKWLSRPVQLDARTLPHGIPRLYVEPATGRLARNPYYMGPTATKRRQKACEKAEFASRTRTLERNLVLMRRDDGKWWEVQLAETTWDAPYRDPDVVERANLNRLPRERRYGRYNVYAVAKRPLSKQELRRHNLRTP